MRPDDPVYVGPLGYGEDDCDGTLLQYGHDGRVAFQRRAAEFMGCAFGDVTALRRYARIYTRQEVWDSYGRDYARDELAMHLKVGYYFAHASGIPAGMGEGYYYDGIDIDTGDLIPVSDEHRALLEAEEPKVVPDDWVMPPDSEWPVWQFVDRFDSRGFPVLIAEEM